MEERCKTPNIKDSQKTQEKTTKFIPVKFEKIKDKENIRKTSQWEEQITCMQTESDWYQTSRKQHSTLEDNGIMLENIYWS